MSNCRALTYLFASMLVLVQTSLPALAQYANNSLTAPQLTTPNYWGDSRVQSVGMGDYRNPYTGNQVYDNGTTLPIVLCLKTTTASITPPAIATMAAAVELMVWV
ncbi:MAG: hypothetical protein IPO31_06585 [Candidatus Obscuribacter sp.]|nr:hypothetical protein [Candidatus Obscuribacter sp.]